MKICELLERDRVTLSFEVFPPKQGGAFEPVLQTTERLSHLQPDFMSVTYGAGGGRSINAVAVADYMENKLGVTALAHLTCMSSTKDQIDQVILELQRAGIKNVLALRGDRPEDASLMDNHAFTYASDLIRYLRDKGDFCIGAACYPDGHVECENRSLDLEHLKQKVESGVDFLTTQMFFDNNVIYSFLYRLRDTGIKVPVVAGIMPVINTRQILRSCELSGTTMPSSLRAIVDRYQDKPEAMKEAGIAYATSQILDLVSNGIHGIHIYTMNRPEVTERIVSNLEHIIGTGQ